MGRNMADRVAIVTGGDRALVERRHSGSPPMAMA